MSSVVNMPQKKPTRSTSKRKPSTRKRATQRYPLLYLKDWLLVIMDNAQYWATQIVVSLITSSFIILMLIYTSQSLKFIQLEEYTLSLLLSITIWSLITNTLLIATVLVLAIKRK